MESKTSPLPIPQAPTFLKVDLDHINSYYGPFFQDLEIPVTTVVWNILGCQIINDLYEKLHKTYAQLYKFDGFDSW